MAAIIQLRGDTAANWASQNPVLADREIALETDTLAYKIGDGVTAWNSLNYRNLSAEMASILLESVTVDPSTPAAGNLVMYAGKVGGRILPKFVGPAGLHSSLQPFLARNKVGYWCPPGNAATVPGVFGFTAYTAVGTATTRNVAVTNFFTRMRRLGYVSAGTAGSFAAVRVASPQITIGNGANMGGFHKVIRFGISDAALVSGARTFCGISSSTAAPTNVEPSTLTNVIGIGHGAADTNMKLYYGGSSAQTPIDLGANFPANTTNTDVYDLALFSPPNIDNTVYYEVTRVNTGDVATGTLTGTAGVALPANTTLLTYTQAWRTNNATAVAVGLDIMSDYIETDN